MYSSFWHTHRRPLIATLLLVVTAVAYYRLVPGGFYHLVLSLNHCDELFCDFTRQYYPTGVLMLTHAEASFGYFYSLFFGLFLSLFGRWPLETAVIVWGGFQLFSALLLLTPVLEFGRKNAWTAVFYVGLLLFSEPFLHNLKWGQISVLMTGCVLTSWVCYRRGWWRTAVVLLAIPTAIKYYTGLFLVYFLLKKDWRFVAAVLGVTAVCLLLPVARFGLAANLAFYRSVNENMHHASSTWMLTNIDSQYFASVISRLLDSRIPLATTRPWLVGLGLAWFVGHLVLLWRYHHTLSDEHIFALLFLSLPFLLETSWPHYFVFLPFCQTAVLLSRFPSPSSPQASHPTLRFALFTIHYSLLTLFPTIFFFRLFPTWHDYSRYGFLLWSDLLLLLNLYLVMKRAA